MSTPSMGVHRRGMCGLPGPPCAESAEARRRHGQLGLRGGAGRQSQHRQEHRLQRAHRAAPAHRQLAGQDRHPRRGRVRVSTASAYKLVDLPGTYSLLAASLDEEVARDFILFGQPDVTVVVVDATRLERNLNLVLQVLEITDRVVVCLNLMDEARRHGTRRWTSARWPATWACRSCPTAARYGRGHPDQLLQAIGEVASGQIVCRPYAGIENEPAGTQARRRRAGHPGQRSLPRACPTPAGWRCGCSTATSASSRPSDTGSWASWPAVRRLRQADQLQPNRTAWRALAMSTPALPPQADRHPGHAPGTAAVRSGPTSTSSWWRRSTPRRPASPTARSPGRAKKPRLTLRPHASTAW